jgi:TolB-like protein/class 3 adenylate cyclase/tetratricopeptide (TPR) repeat protein
MDTEARAERKLAAILVADVVGYSRLARADEERTLARLRSLRSDLIEPTIAVHNGRVVKRTGDGTLAEFRSVVDAVRCAMEVQSGMSERNAGLPPDRRIDFRIGIHIGDVVEEPDGDLMGDGVNIAARLESIAKAGVICISEDAYRQVRGRLDLAANDLGEIKLKNIAEPLRVFSLDVGTPPHARPVKTGRRAPGRAARAAPAVLAFAAIVAILVMGGVGWRLAIEPQPAPPLTSAAAVDSPTEADAERQDPIEKGKANNGHLSIVVLPFANLSSDPTQDYFADGVTDSLTTDLSRLSGSFVIDRSTAFAFKGKNVDVKDVSADLGVRYAIEGSVMRDQGRVRINVQLIDAENGSHIWAERFDKPFVDLLDLQDDIVSRVAGQLHTELIVAERSRAAQTSNPDATDLMYQAESSINKGPTPDNVAKALALCERARSIDPDNVESAMCIANLNITKATMFRADDTAQRVAVAEAAADEAVSIEPNNAKAHWTRCNVQAGLKRLDRAVAECEQALSLDPNMAAAQGELALIMVYLGRAEEAESHIKEALRLSPRDPGVFSWTQIAGHARLWLGEYEAAVAWLRRSVDSNPKYPLARFMLAAALANLDRIDEARTEAQAGLALDPKFTIFRSNANPLSDNPTYMKQRERYHDGLRRAGAPEG